MDQQTYRVIIEEDGRVFHAFVPALPGCHTFGKTIIEAQKNIQEALELYVETLVDLGETVPKDNSFETFHTALIPVRARRMKKKSAKQYA